ncbi:MAG TPA: alkaline phosphatase family protein [Jatrophihabitans sp.]|nr:alkaline phosphatase family protein [Jatrophihabitans sp.]
MISLLAAALVALGVVAAQVTPANSTPAGPSSTPAAGISKPRHVVVVILENHSYREVIGNPAAPYLNRLARTGRSLTHMRGITHPSEPNYLALFSGSTHGIRDDSCPHRFPGANLGSQLRAAGYSFVGWAEGLPRTGSPACVAGEYARKHAPWVNFANLPKRVSRPFGQFPHNYAKLPTVSFVVPNLLHDMHDGTIGQADRWVQRNLAGYARWAKTHDSLLVVTWDEDDGSARNHIPTIITGAGVGRGPLARPVTLYSLLRLLEDLYRLPHLGHARTARPIPLR